MALRHVEVICHQGRGLVRRDCLQGQAASSPINCAGGNNHDVGARRSCGNIGLGSVSPDIQDVANGSKQGVSVERFAKEAANAPVLVGDFVPSAHQEDW